LSLSNKSGIKPVGFSLVIEPEQVEETTESGIITGTPESIEREQMRQTDGVVLAVGPMAFSDEKEVRCKAGDRVVMRAYAGMIRKGVDGRDYRIIADTEVIGILES
jgi:co-chaperonin GroES (HSP10)